METSASPTTSEPLASLRPSPTPLSVYKDENRVAYLLLYVNDIILTAPSAELLWHVMARLHSEFAMTDLGDLHHFSGSL